MMLHLCHTVMDGHQKAFLCRVDSDVIVLSVPLFVTFRSLGLIYWRLPLPTITVANQQFCWDLQSAIFGLLANGHAI